MLLSTQTAQLQKSFGYEEAIRILARAGFDAFDLSLFGPSSENDPLYGENRVEYARHLRQVADEAGIFCNQSHAPFPSSVGEPEKDAQIFQNIVNAMETAAIVGAKCIIVHPKQHLEYRTHIDELKRLNLEFYRSLVPYCEKFGIKVAVENMWQRNPIGKCIVDSTCARPDEFCEYVDMVGSPWIVACLDIGHVTLVGEDHGRLIRALGKDRLQALHVHDVDGVSDLHTLPFVSKIDFQRVMSLLKEIDYQGELTFEADHFYHHTPDAIKPQTAAYMAVVGRQLIRMFDEA